MKFDPQKPFNPPPLPPSVDLDSLPILKMLKDVGREVAELKGYCANVPNPMVLMSMAMTKESVESSKIENIHTTVASVLEAEVDSQSEKRGPDKEVLRYRTAIRWGMDNLAKLSLSTRLILGLHEKLVLNSSGYRKQQNAIANQITGEKIYIPPVASRLVEHMKAWENFANSENKENIDPLVRCALCHYQFEVIHPFGDGNGRTGRILLALQLVSEKLLNYPVLYISGYLNRNRSEYYRTLLAVTESQAWEEYILFILEGFKVQAVKTKSKLFQMEQAFKSLEEALRQDHPRMNALDLVNHLFAYPVTSPTLLSREIGVHYQTASKYLQELKEAGILSGERSGKRHFFYNNVIFDHLL